MTFEFLIGCHGEYDDDIDFILRGLLLEALEANQYDFDDYAILDMVRVNQIRQNIRTAQGTGGIDHTLVGFTVELDEVDSSRAVIDDFASSLIGSGPIYHAIRFEEPLLQGELAGIAAEIFGLEMKLRRVLTFIYLHAYPDQPYDLLQKDDIKPITPNLSEQQMHAVMENQFFYLTFSQYIQLNQRPQPSSKELFAALVGSETYDALRTELFDPPIGNEEDVLLLSNLKELMEPIEAMRNCVAHNRRPSTRVRENYFRTRPLLEERLDQYLADLQPT